MYRGVSSYNSNLSAWNKLLPFCLGLEMIFLIPGIIYIKHKGRLTPVFSKRLNKK